MSHKSTIVSALVEKGVPADIANALDTRGLHVLAKAKGIDIAPPAAEAEVVSYTTQGKGKTGQYLDLRVAGAARNGFFKLCDGDTLTDEGKAKLVAIANAVADLME
jgi:hypothetical protein